MVTKLISVDSENLSYEGQVNPLVAIRFHQMILADVLLILATSSRLSKTRTMTIRLQHLD
jgi:hypothetical protein